MPPDTVAQTVDIETQANARPGDTLGYARVSTADQSVTAQDQRLVEAGAIRVFTDVISGKTFERPGLAQLIDYARPGDRLCITRLDRLGRSLRELLETVDNLKARSIHFVSLEEKLDTSSAAGELVFHVFGAIAHFERRLISERTRDGLAAGESADDAPDDPRSPRKPSQRWKRSSTAACRRGPPQSSSGSGAQPRTASPERCETRRRSHSARAPAGRRPRAKRSRGTPRGARPEPPDAAWGSKWPR